MKSSIALKLLLFISIFCNLKTIYGNSLAQNSQYDREAQIDLAKRNARVDGEALAKAIGIYHGQRNGDRHGKDLALATKKQRSLEDGIAQGKISERVHLEEKIKAEVKRTSEELAYREKATSNAQIEAKYQAEYSRAATVGKQLGEKRGKERAQTEGQLIGTAKGKAQAIDKYENRILMPMTYQGTFSNDAPEYKGVFCNSYQIKKWGQAPCLLKAKTNYLGLELYHADHRQSFLAHIDVSYWDSFEAASKAAYQENINGVDQNALITGIEQGKEQIREELEDYLTKYYKNKYYRESLAKIDLANPLYQTFFRQAYKKSFQKEWRLIRDDQAEIHSKRAYSEYIESEISKNKELAYREMAKYYEENPALELLAFTHHDGGSDEAIAKDGIYQPGEKIIYHFLVRNYGLIAAENKKITINNQTFTLPTIRPNTEMNIKALGYGIIPVNFKDGDQYPFALNFDDQEMIKTKSIKISYPLKVKAKIANIQNHELNLTLSNNSAHPIQEKIKVVISTSPSSSLEHASHQQEINIAPYALTNFSIKLDQKLSSQDYFNSLDLDLTIIKEDKVLGKSNESVRYYPRTDYLSLIQKAKKSRPSNNIIMVSGLKREQDKILSISRNKMGQDFVFDLSLKSNQKLLKAHTFAKKGNIIISNIASLKKSQLTSLIHNNERRALILHNLDQAPLHSYYSSLKEDFILSVPYRLHLTDGPDSKNRIIFIRSKADPTKREIPLLIIEQELSLEQAHSLNSLAQLLKLPLSQLIEIEDSEEIIDQAKTIKALNQKNTLDVLSHYSSSSLSAHSDFINKIDYALNNPESVLFSALDEKSEQYVYWSKLRSCIKNYREQAYQNSAQANPIE